VAVQEVRWDKGGIGPADDYTFFYVNRNQHLRAGPYVHKGIRSAVKRIDLVCSRMSYTTSNVNVHLRIIKMIQRRACVKKYCL
jgi:hypothetical protein